MKRVSAAERNRQLRRLAAMTDENIDLSDIPELTAEQFRRGLRGIMYRPVKHPVTIRLDADVLKWLKNEGPGYQTKVNALLRTEMVRSLKKKPARAAKRSVAPRKKRK